MKNITLLQFKELICFEEYFKSKDPLIEDSLNFLVQNNCQGFLTTQQVNLLCQKYQLTLVELATKLLNLAKLYATPEVSQFFVGAVAITATNQFYFGANHEFKQLPITTTIHAEQSAIMHAYTHKDLADHITDLVVSAMPCGHCRQFMCELSHNLHEIKIHVNNTHYTLAELLPFAFTGADLDLSCSLNKPEITAYSDYWVSDKLLNVLNNLAYAPYTKNKTACELILATGDVYYGCSIESGAYNPSCNALACGINNLLMAKQQLTDLRILNYCQVNQVAFTQKIDVHNFLELAIDSHCRVEFYENFTTLEEENTPPPQLRKS